MRMATAARVSSQPASEQAEVDEPHAGDVVVVTYEPVVVREIHERSNLLCSDRCRWLHCRLLL